jgi:hypothetical protein
VGRLAARLVEDKVLVGAGVVGVVGVVGVGDTEACMHPTLRSTGHYSLEGTDVRKSAKLIW